MTFEQQLDIYLRARCPLLILITPEEARALDMIKNVCENPRRTCFTWDAADFFQPLTPGASPPTGRDPLSALEQIDKAEGDILFVLKDFHDCWNDIRVKRKLRGLAQRLRFSRKTILVTTPSSKLPDELKDEVVILQLPPPSAPELEAVLDNLTRTPGVRVNLTKLGREKLIQAALGLTTAQAQRVFAKGIVADGVLDDRDIDMVTEEKKQVIRESEALEFYPIQETVSDVGGLGVLKDWLRLRERAFTQEARDYGLPAPKGMALIGIPGTGKSLTAKMIGGLWRLPLLRLDVGAMFGSLVGESEERARRALRVAETTSPCLSGDTRVTLADGSERTLEELYNQHQDDLRVLGMTERFELCPVAVAAVTRRPAPDLYRIRLAHGELRATGNHLHPVLRDGELVWVRTDQLTEGDHVAVPRQVPTPAEAPSLLAWLRGHFDGDGCISDPATPPKCTITAKVPEVNRLVRSVLQRVGFPTTNDRAKNIEITGFAHVRRFIEVVGSSHPAKQERMSAWLEQNPPPEVKDRTDVIPVGRLLRSARQSLGMGSQHFRDTGCSLVSSYERNLIHPSRARLRSLIREMHNWADTPGKDVAPLDALRRLAEAPIAWSRVRAVTVETPPEFVYDLVCEAPHTFVASGVLTHNCILWIDELEKALAHGGNDSGTSTRVFGTILTWMQEKKAPVFVVATANDITSLPPELLRKGRFDEIFFLDLPTQLERKEILGVHLQKRKRMAADFDVDRLARESQGYVGAELEQAIIDAMYVGFNAGREFTTEDIAQALKRLVPLSVSQRETIEMLRSWLKEGRAQSASFQETSEATQQFVPLQLNSP